MLESHLLNFAITTDHHQQYSNFNQGFHLLFTHCN